MYLKHIIIENAGPLDKIDIDLRFDSENNPVPCVIVGENGSGKSILLSFIVDSFFEFAEQGFQDATLKVENGHRFFKTISGNQIKVGKTYFATLLEFKDEESIIRYVDKAGERNYTEFISDNKLEQSPPCEWGKIGNAKKVTINKTQSKTIFNKDVICFFPPSRYEKPIWMYSDYIDTDIGFGNPQHFSDNLKYKILVNNASSEIMRWIYDVIADSRADVVPDSEGVKGSFNLVYPIPEHLAIYIKQRQNIESILGTVLGEPVVFRMLNRNSYGQRLAICNSDGQIIIPSLEALSTGQMALFLLFSSILRYSDYLDIKKTQNMASISGIVIIDEIDLHLHCDLQSDTVAKLMRLFPKVQFIISTHAPLVLLSLEEEYGERLDIIELPSGHKISSEQFSQFDSAYKFITETERYRKEIKKAIDKSNTEKPLIVTEGATDWRHIKAAFQALKEDEEYAWLNELDFDFLEYSPVKDEDIDEAETTIRIKMSADELKAMASDYCKIPQKRRMIFVADRDVSNIVKQFDGEKGYKSWGNNVYTMVLPVPEHRKETPDICIEFLYHDEDIVKRVNINGLQRRVFLGNEFDKYGHYYDGDIVYFCKDLNAVGPEKLTIIDGCSDKKVIKIGVNESEKTNYALSKMNFAKMVLNKQEPFDNMDFKGFIPLFETIRDIIELQE